MFSSESKNEASLLNLYCDNEKFNKIINYRIL